MKIQPVLIAATVMFIAGACGDGRDTRTLTGPSASVEPHAVSTAAGPIQTSGEFEAIVDFSTLTLRPTGRNCLLTVSGQLVFHGTIAGSAPGTTTALVFAACEDVAANPPGVFPDRFKSELTFSGSVEGQQASASVLYLGRSAPGGHISGRLIFSRGVEGRLQADAQLAVGGTYSGSVVVN